jgi:hypothetical protein
MADVSTANQTDPSDVNSEFDSRERASREHGVAGFANFQDHSHSRGAVGATQRVNRHAKQPPETASQNLRRPIMKSAELEEGAVKR